VSPGQRREQELQIAQPALRFEGQQPQVAVVQAGARSQLIQDPAERAHPHRQDLRHIHHAAVAVPVLRQNRLKEGKRKRSPGAEALDEVEHVTQPPFQRRVHARHHQRVGADSSRHDEVTRGGVPRLVLVVDAPHGDAFWRCFQQLARHFGW